MPTLDRLRDKYLTADARGLGAGRIALGAVLLLDLLRRLPVLTLWYTNAGLLPNHTVLWRPPFPYTFSLFFTASHAAEAALGFVLCAAAYLMLLLGFRTRLAQLASLIAVLSLHGRVLFAQNSGDVVLVEICLWTSFLPLGRRYSLDSLQQPDDGAPVVSMAVLALLAQLAVIYLFNAAHKNGSTWRDGTAVHYVLYYANVVTPLGVWARGLVTPGLSRFLTWSTRATEALLPLLILTPVARRAARWLAVALIVLLHVGFGLFLNLGIFVPAMLVFTPFLVPRSDWDGIERWSRGTRLAARLRALLARWWPELHGRRWPAVPPAGPGRRRWEVAVVALMAMAALGALVDNASVTRVPPSVEPTAMNALRTTLQLFQSWSLFAPDVPTTEGTLVVDAVTSDGRHVDPLNEALSPAASGVMARLPARLGNDSFAAAYLLRLPSRPEYFGALGEWLQRYPERTGRAADAIRSFRVLGLEQDDPPPGQRTSRNLRTVELFRAPN